MNFARLRRMSLSAVLGALVFGSWAYVANFDFPDHRLHSALAQATFSFFFSFVIVALAELVFGWLAGKRSQVALAIGVPWSTSVVGGALVHLAAHTPSMGLTVLGPALVGLVFGTLYVLNLKRLRDAALVRCHSEPRTRSGARNLGAALGRDLSSLRSSG